MLAAFTEHGTERLKPIFEALEEVIPYDELHILRMVALCPRGRHLDSAVNG